MAERTGSATSPTEVIPAGHAAPSADEEGATPPRTGLAGLSIAALGIVFGDIGTSPAYTFRECFNPEHGLQLSPENVLGVRIPVKMISHSGRR
jgi:K+ transporter